MEENEEDDGLFARSSLSSTRSRFWSKSIIVGKRRGHLRSDSVPTLFKSETTQKRFWHGMPPAKALRRASELCNRFGTLHGGCIATLVDAPDDMCTSHPEPARAQRGRRDDGPPRVS